MNTKFAILKVCLSYEMRSVEARAYIYCFCKVAKSKRSAHSKHFFCQWYVHGQEHLLDC